MRKLRVLAANFNEFTDIAALAACKSLVELYLTNNKIEKLPHTIGMLKNLEMLSVDENELTELPPEVNPSTLRIH
ncbi:unnamed protein product [Gongylonema pulchrum]|uniref:Uncharacterized protein n=1 Tax=Gongylonema pulchrum TaxID=637853 RepID=A0A3P6S7B8_9BILA|nr:unnamed protein product [Gongylonema pulchrum]